jgi:hypothetical protein
MENQSIIKTDINVRYLNEYYLKIFMNLNSIGKSILVKNIAACLLVSFFTLALGCHKDPAPSPANKAPVADAGADQAITLPVSTVTFAGSGTDPDGTISSYAWTKISGPVGESITTASTATTTVTGLVTGVYVFRLTVTDNKGASASDDVQVTVSTVAGNMPPSANAGTDQAIILPTSQVNLSGSGTDIDGTITGYTWTKVSGPAGGIITTPSAATTTVTGLIAGIYVFRLTVTDNSSATGTDDVQVTVTTAANVLPVANAGADQTIGLPANQVNLAGSGTDTDGTISGYGWTKLSGPAGESIVTPSSATTNVTGLVAGVYIFTLTVTDNMGATGTDNIQVTVNAATATNFDYFVSSQNTNSVKRYNGTNGAYLGDFVAPGSGGLAATQEVRWAADGNLLVCGSGNTSILKYDKNNGNFLGQFTTGYSLQTPTKMSIGADGNIYVSQWDAAQNKVVRFNGTTGAYIDEFTDQGLGLNNGMGHAWDATGNFYVAGFNSRDIKKYDANGHYVGIFIPTGTGIGQLMGPVNIWFDNNNNFFVVDWRANNVKKYNATTGAFIAVYISGLSRCEGFTFDLSGNLYVCNYLVNQVNKYDANGNFISVVVTGGGLNVTNSVIIGPTH